MPFRSKRQQRFMFATMPEAAKEWSKKTDFTKLPERVRKKKKVKKKIKTDMNDIDKLLQMANVYEWQVKLAFEKRDAIHLILDLVGFVPVLGEAADFTNVVLYIEESKYFLAALSLISMIPEIGDAVGKSAKTMAWLAKTAPDATEFVIKHGPKVAEVIKDLRTVIKANRTLIEKVFSKAEKHEKLKDHMDKIRDALDAFVTS